jgi:hypothetical protein
MCEPTTLALASLALTTASTISSVDAQRSTANKQADAARTSGNLQEMDIARQADQQAQADAAEMNAHAKQAAHDAALFDVVAGEYGGGATQDRNRAVAGVQVGEQMATISGNAMNAQGESKFASMASRMRTNAQLASIQQPNYLGAALQLGAAGVNTYGTVKAIKAREAAAEESALRPYKS